MSKTTELMKMIRSFRSKYARDPECILLTALQCHEITQEARVNSHGGDLRELKIFAGIKVCLVGDIIDMAHKSVMLLPPRQRIDNPTPTPEAKDE